jgi:nitrogen fixation NifU-like protein
MLNMYQEILMDHYKNPRNRGKIANGSFCVEQRNSSCGDEVVCTGVVSGDRLSRVEFDGKGCVISQATASLLSERVAQMTCLEILMLDKDYLLAMIGMALGPVRVQCALLPLIALHKGIKEFVAQRE